MVKISRNQPCPCGSGKKYKHCCLPTGKVFENSSQAAGIKISLMSHIKKIQGTAAEKKQLVYDFGVFIFFSNHDGDAWVLEVAEKDGLQVAKGGVLLDIELEENSETIEIHWSHTWDIRNKRFFLTAYQDKKEIEQLNTPVQQIHAALRRVHKRYTTEMLVGVHLQ